MAKVINLSFVFLVSYGVVFGLLALGVHALGLPPTFSAPEAETVGLSIEEASVSPVTLQTVKSEELLEKTFQTHLDEFEREKIEFDTTVELSDLSGTAWYRLEGGQWTIPGDRALEALGIDKTAFLGPTVNRWMRELGKDYRRNFSYGSIYNREIMDDLAKSAWRGAGPIYREYVESLPMEELLRIAAARGETKLPFKFPSGFHEPGGEVLWTTVAGQQAAFNAFVAGLEEVEKDLAPVLLKHGSINHIQYVNWGKTPFTY